jgi:hypothetical protein
MMAIWCFRARHVDLVFATALRQTGDHDVAEEIKDALMKHLTLLHSDIAQGEIHEIPLD